MIRRNAIVCLLLLCCLAFYNPAPAAASGTVEFTAVAVCQDCYPLDFSQKGLKLRVHCLGMTCKMVEFDFTKNMVHTTMQLGEGVHYVYLEIEVPDSRKVLGIGKLKMTVGYPPGSKQAEVLELTKSDITVTNCTFKVDNFRESVYFMAKIFK